MNTPIDVHALFPTFVWSVQLEKHAYEEINRTIKAKLDELTSGMRPLRRGDKLQTDPNLHTMEEFQGLNDVIHEVAIKVLDFLKIKYNSCEISGCWANITASGVRHKPHVHPNNFLSGVYYVETPQGGDTISFEDPRVQRGVIAPDVTESTPENAGRVPITVGEGQLVMFPAWLSHFVERNTSDDVRISVAFNLMFPDYGSTMSAPVWSGNIPPKQQQ